MTSREPNPAPTPIAVTFSECAGVELDGCSDCVVASVVLASTPDVFGGVVADNDTSDNSLLSDVGVGPVSFSIVWFGSDFEICEPVVVSATEVPCDVVELEIDDNDELLDSFLIQNAPLRNPLPCLSDTEPKASTARRAKGRLLLP